MWRQKLQTNVSFPMSQLDMSSYVVGPKSATRYNLHAVSNHYGTMHGGHYTAFAKCVYDKKWYKFDDQYVTEMSPREVVVCTLTFIILSNSKTYSRFQNTCRYGDLTKKSGILHGQFGNFGRKNHTVLCFKPVYMPKKYTTPTLQIKSHSVNSSLSIFAQKMLQFFTA